MNKNKKYSYWSSLLLLGVFFCISCSHQRELGTSDGLSADSADKASDTAAFSDGTPSTDTASQVSEEADKKDAEVATTANPDVTSTDANQTSSEVKAEGDKPSELSTNNESSTDQNAVAATPSESEAVTPGPDGASTNPAPTEAQPEIVAATSSNETPVAQADPVNEPTEAAVSTTEESTDKEPVTEPVVAPKPKHTKKAHTAAKKPNAQIKEYTQENSTPSQEKASASPANTQSTQGQPEAKLLKKEPASVSRQVEDALDVPVTQPAVHTAMTQPAPQPARPVARANAKPEAHLASVEISNFVEHNAFWVTVSLVGFCVALFFGLKRGKKNDDNII